MEQQNQQPVQEKIENKPPAKTNTSTSSVRGWKLFAAIAIAAAVLSIGGILLLKAIQFSSSPAPLPGNNLQTLEGRLISESLEGECWHLRAAPSGSDPVEGIKTFELLGISEEDLRRYEHQWVQVKGRIREDMASVCQLGPIFEVQQISTTEKNNQQSTVDTSTWQTYRSDEFGFEFKYPSGWSVNNDEARYFESNESYPRFTVTEPGLIKDSKCYAAIIFKDSKNPEKSTYSLYSEVNQKQNCQQRLDQILSTFRFAP